MTIIEQIKAEIEKRILREREVKDRYDSNTSSFVEGSIDALDGLLSFLSTLESEKPINQEELDQEIIKCWQEWISQSNKQSVDGVLHLSEFAFYARHFAKWGVEHLKK